MKKWFFLFLALVLVINIVSMGIGCKAKEAPKPAAKEEAKPAEAPAPPAPTTRNASGGLMIATQINDTITKFLDAFNANDLDRVMTFFSDEAVYEPGDGKTHRGKAEIRAAFEPQFNGAFGAMRFDEHDRLIDAENRKAALRWVSRHDMSHAKSRGLVMALKQMITRLFVGERFGWQGVDVFHFDANGKIKGKFTYGWYGSRPHIQRTLG
jgi:ketosteroid isomerase-like protein